MKSAWFAAAFLLITSPWLVTNWQLNGSPFSNSAHEHIAAEYFHPDGVALGTAMDEVREEFSSLTDVVLHDPPRFAKEYVARILVRRPEKLASQVVRFPGYLLAAWGLVLLLADLNRRRAALLVLFGLGYLQMGLGIFQTRFYLFLCPILFLFVAIVPFRSSLIGSIRWAFVRHGVAWSMLLLAALSLAHTSRWAIDHTLKIEPRHLLGMATELRSLVEPGQVLIGRKPHLARLAGLRPGFVLATDAADFRARSLSIGARYIEYSDAGAKLWPAMAALRDPEALPAGYRLIYTHQGTNTRVYELE
ncbi:MAG: hypothetical protein GY725_13130 [bacterium]|nr:hypothetical protein [bacterium]